MSFNRLSHRSAPIKEFLGTDASSWSLNAVGHFLFLSWAQAVLLITIGGFKEDPFSVVMLLWGVGKEGESGCVRLLGPGPLFMDQEFPWSR